MKNEAGNIKSYIGLRIKFICNMRHLTITSIANRLGVTRKQFQSYEHGKTDIKVSRLGEIAKTLNVAPIVFLAGYNKYFGMSDADRIFLINYSKIKSKDIKNSILGLLNELV